MPISDQQIQRFRRKVFRFYQKHKRDLPWRKTNDPYRITVSEIMLQQTQVDRVIPKYHEWISRWPTWRALSRATSYELLSAWSGLGYNRRALFLGKMARAIVHNHKGQMPDDPDGLRKLPGVGPYTSRAILIFAFNRPLATIDTNIRRVLIHEFGLSGETSVAELEDLAYRVLPKRRSREWHNALMDYSRLVLPRQMKHVPPVSRQSRFEGSLRQIRGEIIRQLVSQQSITAGQIIKATGRSREDVALAIEAMTREGIVQKFRNRLTLAD